MPITMQINTQLVVEQRVPESSATTQKLSLLEKMVELIFSELTKRKQ